MPTFDICVVSVYVDICVVSVYVEIDTPNFRLYEALKLC